MVGPGDAGRPPGLRRDRPGARGGRGARPPRLARPGPRAPPRRTSACCRRSTASCSATATAPSPSARGAARDVLPGGGILRPTVLADGLVEGTWRFDRGTPAITPFTGARAGRRRRGRGRRPASARGRNVEALDDLSAARPRRGDPLSFDLALQRRTEEGRPPLRDAARAPLGAGGGAGPPWRSGCSRSPRRPRSSTAPTVSRTSSPQVAAAVDRPTRWPPNGRSRARASAWSGC